MLYHNEGFECNILILIALSVAAVSAMQLGYEMPLMNTNGVVFSALYQSKIPRKLFVSYLVTEF